MKSYRGSNRQLSSILVKKPAVWAPVTFHSSWQKYIQTMHSVAIHPHYQSVNGDCQQRCKNKSYRVLNMPHNFSPAFLPAFWSRLERFLSRLKAVPAFWKPGRLVIVKHFGDDGLGVLELILVYSQCAGTGMAVRGGVHGPFGGLPRHFKHFVGNEEYTGTLS